MNTIFQLYRLSQLERVRKGKNGTFRVHLKFISLTFSTSLDEPFVSPLPSRPAGFGEGLLVSVLFRVDLIIQILFCQFISAVYLQLNETTKHLVHLGKADEMALFCSFTFLATCR